MLLDDSPGREPMRTVTGTGPLLAATVLVVGIVVARVRGTPCRATRAALLIFAVLRTFFVSDPFIFSCRTMSLFHLKTCTPMKGTPRSTA